MTDRKIGTGMAKINEDCKDTKRTKKRRRATVEEN
jgi:hypothetical protein